MDFLLLANCKVYACNKSLVQSVSFSQEMLISAKVTCAAYDSMFCSGASVLAR